MTGLLEEVVAKLLAAHDQIAESAVTAMRAETDAVAAKALYEKAAKGSEHPKICAAITDIRTASEKSAKIGRLLEEARSDLAAYVNRIAPGSITEQQPDQAGLPTGEKILDEASRRARRADMAWRKQLEKAGDYQDSLKQAEKGAKATFDFFKSSPPPGSTSIRREPSQPAFEQSRPSQLDSPITAAIMTTGALALVAKATWDSIRARRERKQDDDKNQPSPS
ncbi:hypothetical protein ACWDV4_22315 [Micromonospora sp. NPDC003197]